MLVLHLFILELSNEGVLLINHTVTCLLQTKMVNLMIGLFFLLTALRGALAVKYYNEAPITNELGTYEILAWDCYSLETGPYTTNASNYAVGALTINPRGIVRFAEIVSWTDNVSNTKYWHNPILIMQHSLDNSFIRARPIEVVRAASEGVGMGGEIITSNNAKVDSHQDRDSFENFIVAFEQYSQYQSPEAWTLLHRTLATQSTERCNKLIMLTNTVEE